MFHRISADFFTLTPEVEAAMAAVRDDRAFAKSRIALLPGGLEAAPAHYADRPTPQVVVVEDDSEDSVLLGRLERLAEVCEPGTRVVVVGARNDIALYRRLLAQGVSDYLLRPVAARQVTAALDAIFADPAAPSRGKVVAFWGVRGGAGASTLAQNVAWALGRGQGEAAVYLDLDLAFGTSLLACNLDAKQSVADALANPDRLDQVLLERVLVAYDEALSVLPSPGDPRAAGEINPEGVDKLVDLAARMAPAVVVDLPHLWTPWTQHILAVADEAVLVANPDLFSLRDAKSMVEILGPRRGEAAPLRLALNKLDAARRTQLSPRDFEETLNLAPSLALPFDPLLFGTAANNGQMLREAAKSHKIPEQIAAFATLLLGRQPVEAKARARKGMLAWLRKT